MSERPIWRLVAGQKRGPYAPARLRPLVGDGRIGSLDRFSYDGIAWAPIEEFPELLREPAPPHDEVYTVDIDEDEPVVAAVPTGVPDRDDTHRGLLMALYIVMGIGTFLILVLIALTLITIFGRISARSFRSVCAPGGLPPAACAVVAVRARVACPSSGWIAARAEADWLDPTEHGDAT